MLPDPDLVRDDDNDYDDDDDDLDQVGDDLRVAGPADHGGGAPRQLQAWLRRQLETHQGPYYLLL